MFPTQVPSGLTLELFGSLLCLQALCLLLSPVSYVVIRNLGCPDALFESEEVSSNQGTGPLNVQIQTICSLSSFTNYKVGITSSI